MGPHMLKLQIPGKLFLAGEFAVTHSGHSSLVMAIDRYIDFKIKPASQIEIQSDLLGAYSIPNNQLKNLPNTLDEQWQLIQSALNIFEEFRKDLEKSPALKPFSLEIESHLSIDHIKIGLGSSGATVVGVLASLLQFHQISFSKTKLFKLASLALLQLPKFKKGSMGDIAAACFGGIVFYQKFDQAWAEKEKRQTSLLNLINMEWPLLKLENAHLPNNWHLLVGWTKSPADTQTSLKQINQSKSQELESEFLIDSDRDVLKIQKSLAQNDWSAFNLAITSIQKTLINYTINQNIPYQTPALQHFLSDAKLFNLPSKISGAGNGDNGIAFTLNRIPDPKLLDTWKTHGIQNLPLNIAPVKGTYYGI